MEATFTIPHAADRPVLLRYRAAHVERLRMILTIRGAARVGQELPPSVHEHLDAANAELAALEHDERIPFAVTCDALGLDAFQRGALAAIAAPHFDHDLRETIAHFWGQPTRRHVDAALLVGLSCDSTWERIARGEELREGSPLHTAGLVESSPVPSGHVASQLEHELSPTTRLLRLFEGVIGLEPRFRGIATLLPCELDAAVGVVEPARLREIALLVTSAHQALRGGGGVVLLAGPGGAGKLRLVQTLGALMRTSQLLVVEASQLPTDPLRLAKTIEALGHEAELLAARLVLRRVDAFCSEPRLAAHLRHALASSPFRVWTTSDLDPARVDAPNLADLTRLRISVALPDLALRRAAWRAELARSDRELADDQLDTLAADYPLSRSAIEAAVRMSGALTPLGAEVGSVLPRIAESQMLGQLGRFAKLSRSKTRIADVVLSDNTREQVDELLVALRRRRTVMERWGLAQRHAIGRGIVAMFNGPPGTGKTLTASAIANDIGMPLYRIDASAIVDSYVGETEKNLVRLFDEAASSRAALLFDEADSLFGKRIEAKDATDRYANTQINILLNLIEDYDGFVVLTTNLKGALDDAFLRRIIYKIVFERPEEEQLIALWDYHLPVSIARAPDVDLAALADEFDQLAGGDIKNAVLRATLGTGEDEPITQQVLRRAVVNELRANGNVVVG